MCELACCRMKHREPLLPAASVVWAEAVLEEVIASWPPGMWLSPAQTRRTMQQLCLVSSIRAYGVKFLNSKVVFPIAFLCWKIPDTQAKFPLPCSQLEEAALHPSGWQSPFLISSLPLSPNSGYRWLEQIPPLTKKDWVHWNDQWLIGLFVFRNETEVQRLKLDNGKYLKII